MNSSSKIYGFLPTKAINFSIYNMFLANHISGLSNQTVLNQFSHNSLQLCQFLLLPSSSL